MTAPRRGHRTTSAHLGRLAAARDLQHGRPAPQEVLDLRDVHPRRDLNLVSQPRPRLTSAARTAAARWCRCPRRFRRHACTAWDAHCGGAARGAAAERGVRRFLGAVAYRGLTRGPPARPPPILRLVFTAALPPHVYPVFIPTVTHPQASFPRAHARPTPCQPRRSRVPRSRSPPRARRPLSRRARPARARRTWCTLIPRPPRARPPCTATRTATPPWAAGCSRRT